MKLYFILQVYEDSLYLFINDDHILTRQEESGNLFVNSVCKLFSGFEAIHARSYSTIFQTLCTNERIDELFKWVEENPYLQKKVEDIVENYHTINDKESYYLALVSSLCLEGICFYSGFFLPLWLAGQGKMTHSGEIISLILRDEQLHTLYVGYLLEQLFETFPEERKEVMKKSALSLIAKAYENELKYSEDIYKDTELYNDVVTYIKFNVDYACKCAKLDPVFYVSESDVNPIVMNGYSVESKHNDVFSSKGNSYVKAVNVEPMQDEDYIF